MFWQLLSQSLGVVSCLVIPYVSIITAHSSEPPDAPFMAVHNIYTAWLFSRRHMQIILSMLCCCGATVYGQILHDPRFAQTKTWQSSVAFKGWCLAPLRASHPSGGRKVSCGCSVHHTAAWLCGRHKLQTHTSDKQATTCIYSSNEFNWSCFFHYT